jgi:hypothetical protein
MEEIKAKVDDVVLVNSDGIATTLKTHMACEFIGNNRWENYRKNCNSYLDFEKEGMK